LINLVARRKIKALVHDFLNKIPISSFYFSQGAANLRWVLKEI
jgi:hypothetical protein